MNIKLPMMWRQCARGSVDDVVRREWQTNTKKVFHSCWGFMWAFFQHPIKPFIAAPMSIIAMKWKKNGEKTCQVFDSSWECTCFYINMFFLLIGGGCSNMEEKVARSGASHFPPFSLNLETLCNAMDGWQQGEAFTRYTQFTTQITSIERSANTFEHSSEDAHVDGCGASCLVRSLYHFIG